MWFVLGQVILEEAMRDSLIYAKPGEPSLVVQLHASKQLAQEQCQVLTQENRALAEANRELKDKVRKWIYSGRCASLIEVTQLVDWQLVYRSPFTRGSALTSYSMPCWVLGVPGNSISRHFERR